MTEPRWKPRAAEPEGYDESKFLGQAAGVDVYRDDDTHSHYTFLIVSESPNRAASTLDNWSWVGIDADGNLDFLDDDAYVSVPEMTALYKMVEKYRDA